MIYCTHQGVTNLRSTRFPEDFYISSEDPDEMQHFVAFHLVVFHCLPKCPFMSFLYTKGYAVLD